MFAVQIEGMCEGKNMPCFCRYEDADKCFQDAVDFCMQFRHEVNINLLEFESGRKIISVVVNPYELPF